MILEISFDALHVFGLLQFCQHRSTTEKEKHSIEHFLCILLLVFVDNGH